MSVLDSMTKQPNDLPENGCRSTSRHGSKRTGGRGSTVKTWSEQFHLWVYEGLAKG
jgi:hypothetical protein